MSKHSKLIIPVLVGFMLLLPLSLALPSGLANAKKQSAGQTGIKQANSQIQKCTSDATCLAKAINIVCTQNALCYIGYNAPFLMASPHWGHWVHCHVKRWYRELYLRWPFFLLFFLSMFCRLRIYMIISYRTSQWISLLTKMDYAHLLLYCGWSISLYTLRWYAISNMYICSSI